MSGSGTEKFEYVMMIIMAQIILFLDICLVSHFPVLSYVPNFNGGFNFPLYHMQGKITEC